MNPYKILLFDLDGTLSDPKVGITKSVQYALEKMNMVEADLDKLDVFIGPPLQASFAEHYQFDEETTQTAILWYRERFNDKGMYENEMYQGIPELLQSLKEQGSTLVVATSKPTVFAEQILTYFKINQYFNSIVGSHLDGTRTSKTEIIQYILDKYNAHQVDEFIMIGDRKHDIIGAHNTGIDSIGVTYGYGSPEEVSGANPTYIAGSVQELQHVLLGDVAIK
ncbi:HAD family hydrolase [Fictibacillus iocasae]|uniref:HAD family hydrolase n=1 Tax=Fictibacillus iocasae TaxID=2715437 RepID=A0ABW2NSL6_9BACL